MDPKLDKYEKKQVNIVAIGHAFGTAHFETEKRRYTILDGTLRIPEFVKAAYESDICLVVMGPIGEHYDLRYCAGELELMREVLKVAECLPFLEVLWAVTKMERANWSKDRFDEFVSFVNSCWKSTTRAIRCIPISGILGTSNISERDKHRCPMYDAQALDKYSLPTINNVFNAAGFNSERVEACPWYNGPSLLEALDKTSVRTTNVFNAAGFIRIPITDHLRDTESTWIMGRIQSGIVRQGDHLIVMPSGVNVQVNSILCDDENETVEVAKAGENVSIGVHGLDEEVILTGSILSSIGTPIQVAQEFVAEVTFIGSPDNTTFTAGYRAMMHLNSMVEECEITKILVEPNRSGAYFVRKGHAFTCNIRVNNSRAVECGKEFGRFILRVAEEYQGSITVGFGYVVRALEENEGPGREA